MWLLSAVILRVKVWWEQHGNLLPVLVRTAYMERALFGLAHGYAPIQHEFIALRRARMRPKTLCLTPVYNTSQNGAERAAWLSLLSHTKATKK